MAIVSLWGVLEAGAFSQWLECHAPRRNNSIVWSSSTTRRHGSARRLGILPWLVVAAALHSPILVVLVGGEHANVSSPGLQTADDADLSALFEFELDDQDVAKSPGGDELPTEPSVLASGSEKQPNTEKNAATQGSNTQPTRAKSVAKSAVLTSEESAGDGVGATGGNGEPSEQNRPIEHGEPKPRRVISFALPTPGFGSENRPLAFRDTAGEPDAKEGVRKALAQDQSDHDRDVGMGPSGAIQSATITAVRDSGPTTGTGTFDIFFNVDGVATGIKVIDSEGAGWVAAGQAIRDTLASRKVKFPGLFKGAKVRVQVIAKVVLPSGKKSIVEPALPILPEPGIRKPPGKMHHFDGAEVDKLPDHAHWWDGLKKPQDPNEPSRTIFPSAPEKALQIAGALKFDPVDIGAAKSRLVSANVLSITPL